MNGNIQLTIKLPIPKKLLNLYKIEDENSRDLRKSATTSWQRRSLPSSSKLKSKLELWKALHL